MKSIRSLDRTLTYAVLLCFSALAILPFLGIFLASIQERGAPVVGFTVPSEAHWENFAYAWDRARFGSYLLSSVIVSVSVTAMVALLSILGGFAFGILRFPWRDKVFYLLLLGFALPAEATVVPQYFEFRAIGIIDTYPAIIFPLVGQLAAFGTFWMRAYFLSSPAFLTDAARIDGAGTWTILWRVLVPIGRPAVLTMAMLVFMWSWNAFLLPLVMVSSEGLRTAPLGLSLFKAEYTTDIPGLAAASILVALPVLTIYVFSQRHFIHGMLAGAEVG